MKLFSAASMMALFLAGCATHKTGDVKEQPLETLYQKGLEALHKKKYSQAVNHFEAIQTYHPYDRWSSKSYLMAGYAAYKDKKYEDALDFFETFIHLYPAHHHIAYAHYMRGMCFYERLDPPERDQEMALKALEAFEGILSMPNQTPYKTESRLKKSVLLHTLATKKMKAAKFYLSKHFLSQAYNYFKSIVQDYATTPYVEESLFRMYEIEKKLNLPSTESMARQKLLTLYPKSVWAKKILS